MNSIAEVSHAPSNEGKVAAYHGEYTTTQIVTRLFPQPTLGLLFFQRFVERAKSNQDVLPDEVESVAIICCDSIALLGKELALSNDTTHKYITLYIALGLLTKRKIQGKRYFVLSLGIYHAPETLAANLDYHITHSTTKKSRNKFRQLFVDVKERCLVYGLIASDVPQRLARLNALLQPEKGESRVRLERRFQQAQYLLNTLTTTFVAARPPHDISQVDSFSPDVIAAMLSSTSTSSRVDSLMQRHAQKSTQTSISDRTEIAFHSSIAQKNLPNPAASVDAGPYDGRKNLPNPAASVDAGPYDGRKNLPSSTASVDVGQHDSRKNLPNPAASVDAGQHSTQKNLPNPATSVDVEPHDSRKNLPNPAASVDAQYGTQRNLPNPAASVDGPRDAGKNLSSWKEQIANGQVKQVLSSILAAQSGRRGESLRSENLPTTDVRVDGQTTMHTAASTLLAQLGRRGVSPHTENLPTMPSQVDAQTTSHTSSSTSDSSQGRRNEAVSENLPNIPVQVDDEKSETSTQDGIGGRRNEAVSVNPSMLNTEVDAEKSISSTPNDDEGRRNAESAPKNLPEDPSEVDSADAIRNVYVYSIYNYITYTLRINPRELAEFFAVELENDKSTFPKYRKLFHKNNGEARSAHQLAAAYIRTQVQNYCGDWEMKKPGAFFTQRCREYDDGVLRDAEEMVSRYKDVPVAEFVEKLKQEGEQKKLKKQETKQPVGKPRPKVLLAQLKPLPTTAIDRSKATMSAEEADKLVDIIVDKGRSERFRAVRMRIGKENPHYVVLVDAALCHSPELQCIVYSAQDWQHRQEMGKDTDSITSSVQKQLQS